MVSNRFLAAFALVLSFLQVGCGKKEKNGDEHAVTINRPVASFYAHRDDISGLAFTADGKNVVSASRDGTIAKWDPKTGERKFKIKERFGRHQRIALAKHGDRFVSGNFLTSMFLDEKANPTVRQWSLADGHELQELRGHQMVEGESREKESYRGVRDVAISDDGTRILSGDEGGQAIAWDSVSGQILHSFPGHDLRVEAVAISGDGKFGATGDRHTVRILNLETGAIIKEIRAKGENYTTSGSLAFSPDGTMLLTANYFGKSVRLFDTGTGKLIRELWRGKASSGCSLQSNVSFSYDGKRAATGCSGEAMIWDVGSGKELFHIRAGGKWTRELQSIAFSPDGKLVATGDRRRINLWQLEGDSEHHLALTDFVDEHDPQVPLLLQPALLKGNTDGVTSLQFSADGSLLLAANLDKVIRLYNVDTQAITKTFKGHQDGVRKAYLFRDNSKVSSQALDGTVRLWDVSSGAELRKFAPVAKFAGLSISADETRIVSNDFQSVFVWDVASGDLIETIKIGESQLDSRGEEFCASRCISDVSLSPRDSTKVAVALSNGQIQLWDLQQKAKVRDYAPNPNNPGFIVIPENLRFSADGRRLLVVSWGHKEVYVWDVDSTREVLRIEMPYYDQVNWSAVGSAILSSDAKRVILAVDGFSIVWDAETNRELVRCGVKDESGLFKGSINSIAISPDGRFLADGGRRTLRLWNISQYK